MNNYQKFELERERIKNGIYKLNDFDFRICSCCREHFRHGCTFINYKGVGLWACGCCETNIGYKDKRMEYKIAIDADSLVSKSLHRFPPEEKTENGVTTYDVEKAYFDFCTEIGKIKGAIFFGYCEYEKGDTVEMKILLSPRKSFRHDIYSDYKAKRPERSPQRVELMKTILRRLRSWVEIKENVEADDLAIYYSNQGWLVSAIDKDVQKACVTSCYDYNKYTWSLPYSQEAVENWYLVQALMGDSTDNIKGAKGIGEVGAFKIVHEMEYKHFSNIVQYFESYEDAVLSMRLVRMDQWNGSEVILWNPTKEEQLI